MVKRIKKRVEKPESEEQRPAGEEPGEAPDLVQQLDELAEDEFTRYTANIFKWMVRHRTPLLGALFGSIALVGIGAFVAHRASVGAQEAAAALADATAVYAKALPDPAAGDEAPTEGREKVLDEARAAFDALIDRYGDEPIALLARLGLAGAVFELGRAADAVPHYEQVLTRTDIDPFTRAVALQAKAAALESAERTDDAMQTWQALEALDRNAYGLMARVAVGRLLEAKGDAAGARKHYEQTQKEFAEALDEPANRVYKAEIERNLARLGSDA